MAKKSKPRPGVKMNFFKNSNRLLRSRVNLKSQIQIVERGCATFEPNKTVVELVSKNQETRYKEKNINSFRICMMQNVGELSNSESESSFG